jgi:hypothetical protein
MAGGKLLGERHRFLAGIVGGNIDGFQDFSDYAAFLSSRCGAVGSTVSLSGSATEALPALIWISPVRIAARRKAGLQARRFRIQQLHRKMTPQLDEAISGDDAWAVRRRRADTPW